MAFTGALFGGFGFYVLDRWVLKNRLCYYRIGGAAIVGYLLGAWGAYQSNSCLTKPFDKDIIVGFDKRFARTTLAGMNFNSNYVSTIDHSEERVYKKPY